MRTTSRRLVFQPATYRSFQNGANQIVAAIRPTLGPQARVVAIDRPLDRRMPEVLDDGGLIARRIIEVRNRHADVGAMFVRDFLWRLHEQEGDGTATAAVLFQIIYNEGIRHVAAGYNARRLQVYLEAGLAVVLDELRRLTRPVNDRRTLAHIGATVSYENEVSELLAEIFDIIGPYGRLEIRKGSGRGLEREYVEGMYWERGLVSREMIADPKRMRTDLEEAAIVVSDLSIRQPEALLPVLTAALENGMTNLLLVVGDLSEAAISLLLANNRPGHLRILAVKTPEHGKEAQAAALTDLALLSGARAFLAGAGDTFNRIQASDFGRARRVWADRVNFGLVGGKGDPRLLRRHIADLRSAHDASLDPVGRGKLQARISKLLGGSATLRIGGATEIEMNERLERAERSANVVRGAMREGIVPGGGVALLDCRRALSQRLAQTADPDEHAAYRILMRALSEPLTAIAENAGFDASDALAQIREAGPGHGLDVQSGEVVEMIGAGICDAASMQKAAVYAAVTSAALALTIDVIVHRSEQPTHAAAAPPAKRKLL